MGAGFVIFNTVFLGASGLHFVPVPLSGIFLFFIRLPIYFLSFICDNNHS